MIHKSIFRRCAAIVALCALFSTFCLTQTGCSNASVISNIQAAVNGASDVVKAMKSIDPNDKRIASIERWVTDGQAFLNAYQTAPGACADLASRAASLVDAFTASILPLMSVSPVVAAAIVGIDVALRVIAANFHTCIQKVQQAGASAGGTLAARSILASDASTIQSADTVFTRYLATPKLKK